MILTTNISNYLEYSNNKLTPLPATPEKWIISCVLWALMTLVLAIAAAGDDRTNTRADIIPPGTSPAGPPVLPFQTHIYQQMFKDLRESAARESTSSDRMITLQSKSLSAIRGHTEIEHGSKVGPGVWLSVLERRGDQLRVRVSGWQQEGISHLIYAAPGKRITSATLSEAMQNKVQHVSTTIVPDTDQTWHKVTLDGWVERGDLVSDDEQLWAYASQMHQQTCAMCHPLPVSEHLSANGWLGRLKAMKLNTNLHQEEYLVLLRYLQLNAADMNLDEAPDSETAHPNRTTDPLNQGVQVR